MKKSRRCKTVLTVAVALFVLSELIYAWIADPAGGVVFSDYGIEHATVTITKQPHSAAEIINPGFEDPVQPNDDDYAWNATGWGWVGTDYIGVWNPTTDDFPGEAPEGSSVAFIWHDPVPAGGTEIEFDNVQFVADPPFPAPAMVTVDLTLFVIDDRPPPVTDTMTIDVYDAACSAARIPIGLGAVEPTDFNGDCVTNLADFAVMALRWLDDNALTEPVVRP